MSAAFAPGVLMPPKAATCTEDGALDELDQTAAGRFGCGQCAANRDAADAAEHELAREREQLAKAQALLRTLRRLEPKPVKAEGTDDEPETLGAIAQAVYIATLRTRIDLYFGDDDQPAHQRRRSSNRP
jgi:hypothetical protein